MGWLPSFFNRNKPQNSQQPLTDSVEKNPATVMEILVEETIMAVAQWLVTFVNRSMQSKQVAQTTEEAPTVDPAVLPEELLLKFSGLVEQLYEREQGMMPLYNRISEIEASLKQNSSFEQHMQISSQNIAALEDRLLQMENQIGRIDIATIETSLQKIAHLEQHAEESVHSTAALMHRLTDVEDIGKQFDSLIERIDEANQNIRTLEQRINHLEKLLARFSIVPKLVERNQQAIVSLQSRIEHLKTPPKNSLRVVSQ
ncbi:hypothetical protein IFO70_29150 [Phormidium tenue FACHB-886]|nr:hypothetical protein [Phormidium tenue FACHB-886]